MLFNKTLLWDVTHACNLRCKHCYNAEKYFSTDSLQRKDLSYEECVQIIDLSAHYGFDHIHLLGGEPLIRSDIFEIISYAKQRRISVTINTNGTLLSDEIIDKIIESKVDQVTVSLDSTRADINDEIRGEGVFNKVCTNLKLFSGKLNEAKSDCILQVATVMTKANLDYLYEYPSLLKKLGVDVLSVLSLYKCGNAKLNKQELMYDYRLEVEAIKMLIKYINNEHPDLYLQLDCKPILAQYINRVIGENCISVGKDICYAAEKIWMIDGNGNILPCSSCDLSTSLQCKENGTLRGKMCNFKEINSFDEILNKDFYISFAEIKNKKELHNVTCKMCEFNNICSGMCPLNINEGYTMCDYVASCEKEFYEEIKQRSYRLEENVFIKSENDCTIIAYKIGQCFSKTFVGWNAEVLEMIAQNIRINDIYEKVSEGCNYDKVIFSRFIFDLKKDKYVKEYNEYLH